MYILGLNAYHADSSACILKDGIILAASEEERFRRIKHWAGFPSEAIRFCLKEANIRLEDLHYIAISRDPKVNFKKKIVYSLKNLSNFKHALNRFSNSKKILSIKHQLADLFNTSLKDISAELHNIEHHRSHIASSFFASDFNKSAVLSIDGFGDFSSTMTAIGDKNKISVLEDINYPHSLGIFYTAATQFLGFLNYGDEYKVMGLSSYGNPIFEPHLHEIIKIKENGFFELNKRYFKHFFEGINMNWDGGKPSIDVLFTQAWEDLFFSARISEELTQEHMDFAASVQVFTEKIIFHMLNHLYVKTQSRNICIAGGVGQNSVANGKILLNTPFEKIYIPSASHDSGTSIGAALYLYNHILKNERKPGIKTAYFGSKFSNKEIISLLENKSLPYVQLDDIQLFDRVVEKLIEGSVVGWFQGRAEFGPRALGNRSILVDPRRKDAQNLLNKKIKRRESFRPFAPSILKEYVSEYFDQIDEVPFMEKVFLIKNQQRKKIPAVTHVDGTGRLQTVDAKQSPRYYRLLDCFKQKTGIPVLLNTSFNENEPIVNHPQEALDCFLRTEMDMLVMENIVIERS